MTDWSRLNLSKIPADRITHFIDHCISDRDHFDLMMYQYGSLVLAASKNLLSRANSFLTKLGQLQETIDGDDTPKVDWTKYKRQERNNNLKLWWGKRRKYQEWMKNIAKLYPKGKATETDISKPDVMFILAKHFSPAGNRQREFASKLVDFRNADLSRQLPWRQIISDQINSGKLTLNDFTPVIEDKRKDIAMKFQFLVEMAYHQYIRLEQATTFGTINIAKESEFGSEFFIKDEKGEYMLEWQKLSKTQKDKVINDLKEGVIVLV